MDFGDSEEKVHHPLTVILIFRDLDRRMNSLNMHHIPDSALFDQPNPYGVVMTGVDTSN